MGSDIRRVRGEAQKELVKKFEVFTSKGRSRWQVWSDWIKEKNMKAIKLTTAESEAVERAYYEASSFEALMAVLCRQLNADANPETAKVIRHYAELCRAAQMKLKMVQEMVISRYLDHQTSAGVQYRFDFVREEVVLLEATAN